MPALFRENRSLIVTLAALLLIILWLASGLLTEEAPRSERPPPKPMLVLVEESIAVPVSRRLTLQGDVRPAQVVTLRARTPGRIEQVVVEKGELVEVEALIARIAMDDRQARLRRAQANVKERQSDYEATRRMVADGMQARLNLEAAEAALEAARAELEAVKLDIDNTRVRTPLAGILDTLHADTGDFVAVGEPLADVVDNNPLKAVVQVPQQNIHLLEKGMPATVFFSGQEKREGEIRYIASRADTGTRTFRVEIVLDNPDRRLPSGISARIEIPLDEEPAHRISPALIGLDDDGRLVIRAVDENQRVELHRAEIIRAEADHVWVGDLPQTLRLITVGQGFVSEGEQVRVRQAGQDQQDAQ